MRAAQYCLPPHSTAYIGCVGKDEYAATLEEAAKKDGLLTLYSAHPTLKTGICSVLLTDCHRSLVADLSAAAAYDLSMLKENQRACSLMKSVKAIYATGFFLTSSPESIKYAAEQASDSNGKTLFTMNLSAPFVAEFYKEHLALLLPSIDILFGNESEAISFAKSFGITGGDCVQEIALEISKMIKKTSLSLVVITQGADATIIASSGRIIDLIQPPLIPSEEIIDTNGAGDAFVGGFLSRFLTSPHNTLRSSVEAGHALAGVIIRQSGVVFPVK